MYNSICTSIGVAQTNPKTSLQVMWPITYLIKELSIFSYYLGTNNISLDKSYDLSTYPFNIYIFNNKNK